MSEVVQGSDYFERRDVLVFINHDDRPDLDIYMHGTCLEKNRAMNKWFDDKSLAVRETIAKRGGVVLEQNWFWSGLRAGLPLENIEIAIDTVRDARHVSEVRFTL